MPRGLYPTLIGYSGLFTPSKESLFLDVEFPLSYQIGNWKILPKNISHEQKLDFAEKVFSL